MSPSVFPPLRWCGQATGAGAGHPHTLPPACPRSCPGGGRPFPSRFPGTGSLSWGMLGAPSSKDACPSPNWSHWVIFLGSLGGPTGAPVGETHESVGPEAEGPGAARRAGLRARRQRSAATVAAAPARPGPAATAPPTGVARLWAAAVRASPRSPLVPLFPTVRRRVTTFRLLPCRR